jgi:uncharacterized protein YkwD
MAQLPKGVTVRMQFTGKGRAAVAIAALISSTLLLPSGATGASGDNTCYTYKRSEKRFKRLVNVERLNKGISRLRLDPELSRVAKVQSRRMKRLDLLHHTPTTKLKNRVTNWNMLGENVGVGGTVPSLHDAFMNSAPHAANVLHTSFKRVGVGVVRNDGRIWVTFIFESIRNPGTTLRMPTC